MAVSSTVSSVSATLTGAEQTVAIPFAWYQDSELIVKADDVLQVLDTDYTVVTGGNGATSGSIKMTETGPGDGAVVLAYREIPDTHDDAWTAGGVMPGDEVTRAFDRAYYKMQEIKRSIDLGVTLEVGQPAQTPMELGDSPEVIGHDGDGALTPLDMETLATFIQYDGPVGSANIADSAVTAAKLATDAVESAKIKALAVTDAKINDVAWGKLTSVPTDAAGATASLRTLGTSATSACAGNDSRLSDNRTPVSHDHASNKLGQANTHESPDTDTGASSLHHTLGTGANQACAGNDNRLADARTPSAESVVAGKMGAGLFAFKGRTKYTTGTAATYTPPAGVRAIEVELWGAGGGGGGAAADSGQAASGIAGGGGAYCRKLITSLAASYEYTVGAAGTAGSAGANAGGAGGDTTFGTLTAGGGAGGTASTATAGNSRVEGVSGGSASGGDLNLDGGYSGERVLSGALILNLSNPGAAPFMGASMRGKFANAAGAAGINYGCGGGGGSTEDTVTNRAGGAGSGGLIIVTEYY